MALPLRGAEWTWAWLEVRRSPQPLPLSLAQPSIPVPQRSHYQVASWPLPLSQLIYPRLRMIKVRIAEPHLRISKKFLCFLLYRSEEHLSKTKELLAKLLDNCSQAQANPWAIYIFENETIRLSRKSHISQAHTAHQVHEQVQRLTTSESACTCSDDVMRTHLLYWLRRGDERSFVLSIVWSNNRIC